MRPAKTALLDFPGTRLELKIDSLTCRDGAREKCMPPYKQRLESSLLMVGGPPLWYWISLELGSWKLSTFAFQNDFSQILLMLFIRMPFSPIGIVFDFKNKGILPWQCSIVAIKRRLRHQIKACITRMREWPIFSTKFIISQMKSSKQKIGCFRPSPPGYFLFQLPN